MSTSFSLSASDESLLYPEDQLTAPMTTSLAQVLLDTILPGWDRGQGTIGVILNHELSACLVRIKPMLRDGEPDVRRLAAVLFAANMIGLDVVYA